MLVQLGSPNLCFMETKVLIIQATNGHRLIRPVCFYVLNVFLKKILFFLINIFFNDMLMSKIIFKKLKNFILIHF